MTRRRSGTGKDGGSVAIELVAVIPILVLVTIVLVQGWIMMSAVESTTRAARDGARAEARGDDGDAAARAGLPSWVDVRSVTSGACESDATCSRVEVRIPYGVPGILRAGSVTVVRTATFATAGN